MATLVSPGVSIQLIDESMYGSSGPGTVPLIIIATASNKASPDGTGIAAGTIPSNAGKLWMITSQRELTQTFGEPKFYATNGSSIHGHELNEYGLLTAYQYLGIANRILVIRADVDLAQLEPTIYEPRSEALNATKWFDLSETSFGLFTNNGGSVPGLAWDAKVPHIIDRAAEAEGVIFGKVPFASATDPVATTNGAYTMSINDVVVSVTVSSGSPLTIAGVVQAINTAAIAGVEARAARLSGQSFLVLTNRDNTNITVEAAGTGTDISNLLGIDDEFVFLQPKYSLGVEGDLAVVTLENDNIVFQKLKPLDSTGQSDPASVPTWFIVGSTNWKAATPTIARGRTAPVLTGINGQELRLSILTDDVHLDDTVVVTFTGATTITDVANQINTALDNAADGLDQTGVHSLPHPIVLPVTARVQNNALVLVNYAGTDIHVSQDSSNTVDLLVNLGLVALYRGNKLVYAQHTKIPQNGVPGDIWVKTTEPNRGAKWAVKNYSASLGRWATLTSPLYESDDRASVVLGTSAIAGTTYVQFNAYGTDIEPIASHVIKTYMGAGNVIVTGDKIPGQNSVGLLQAGDRFVLTASIPSSTGYTVRSEAITITTPTVDGVVSAINNANIGVETSNVAGHLSVTNTHQLSIGFGYTLNGVDVQVSGRDPLALLGIEQGVYSRWEVLEVEASTIAPTSPAIDGQMWYNTDFRVDIMVNDPAQGDEWLGYRNRYPNTDPWGVIIGGSQPLTQRDGTPLVENDIWLDSSDLENYPRMYRFLNSTWEEIDNSDQTTAFGIVFADARSNSNGQVDGSEEIEHMLVSDFVDPDAPDPRMYPGETLLFNTRYSTYNVKVWRPAYLDRYRAQELEDAPGMQYRVGFKEFPVDTITEKNMGRWVTISGNAVDGSPLMGRHAQRAMVVREMASVIVANQDIRSENLFFNLIAAPGYPELVDEMVTLNVDKKEIAFIVADTPSRLRPTATEINAWATNSRNAPSTGDQGLTTRNTYVGMYYPWGLSTNLDGTEVVVPPSTMALRTIAYNDIVAYPWFAPAGTRRGVISNAASVGYITSEGEYQPTFLNPGTRDALYLNNINPIHFIENVGLIINGQKTLHPVSSALDRINVVRLINYMRYYLNLLAQPYLHEPNDKITRDEVTTTFDRWVGNLVSLRALYDYAIQCDENNNTPTRIDRNELWIDIAIKPAKNIEFINIPIRVRNSGDSLTFSAVTQ